SEPPSAGVAATTPAVPPTPQPVAPGAAASQPGRGGSVAVRAPAGPIGASPTWDAPAARKLASPGSVAPPALGLPLPGGATLPQAPKLERPAPGDPTGPRDGAPGDSPLGLGSPAAWGAGNAGLLVFAAALAAAFLLAAPRPGRRLRLGMATWPPPAPVLSLEHPG
ncbi:MAG TPA: hypothetical protein VFR43_00430, partial [Gaiellaceae bacterium]|nr:hypothetical protein [Gaiellaceae bacterium]